jgi:hypothetical protein
VTSDSVSNREDGSAAAFVAIYEPGPRRDPGLYAALRGPLGDPDARRADRAGETASRAFTPLSQLQQPPRAWGLARWLGCVLVESGLLAALPAPLSY